MTENYGKLKINNKTFYKAFLQVIRRFLQCFSVLPLVFCPLTRKIGKKVKWRPNSVPFEPKNWLNAVDEWESITEAVNERLLQYLGLYLEP